MVRHTTFKSAGLSTAEADAVYTAARKAQVLRGPNNNGFNRVDFDGGYAVAYINFPPHVKWEVHRETVIFGQNGI